MAVPITSMGTLFTEYQNFINSLTNAKASLAAVQAAGTIMYNDATMAAAFPTQWAAFQAFLLSANSNINTFVSGFPAIPPLTS